MFQKRYCVHAQVKVKSSNGRVCSVACDDLENFFVKSYMLIAKLYTYLLLLFLAMNLFDVKK